MGRRPNVRITDEVAETPSRTGETRGYETRKAEKREEISDYESAATYVHPRHWPPGMTYYWIRYKARGEVDDSNWAKRMRQGFKLVPRSRHLDLFPPMPELGAESKASEYIIMAGLVLAEMPTSRWEAFQDKQRKETVEQNNTINSWVEGGTDQTPHFGESSPIEYRRAVHKRGDGFKDDEVVPPQ